MHIIIRLGHHDDDRDPDGYPNSDGGAAVLLLLPPSSSPTTGTLRGVKCVAQYSFKCHIYNYNFFINFFSFTLSIYSG